MRSQRLDLRGPRGRRLFDERKANDGIEIGVVLLRRVEDVARQAPIARAALDKIEKGVGRGF